MHATAVGIHPPCDVLAKEAGSASGVGRQQLSGIPPLSFRPRVAMLSFQGNVQLGQVVGAGQFDHSETRQMWRQPLHVEQIDALYKHKEAELLEV